MGGDGGSIPKRDDLVKQRKEHKTDKQAEETVKWRNCALSQETLCKPIVTCGLGRLYNKTAVIEFLLDRSKYASVAANASHIHSLRDVVELKVSSGEASAHSGIHTCPVSGTSMNGKFAFACLTNCGCTIAERALRELHRSEPSSSTCEGESDATRVRACPVCSKAYREHEIILLNVSSGEQLRTNEVNMAKRCDEKTAAKRRPNAPSNASVLTTQPSTSSASVSGAANLKGSSSKHGIETAEKKKTQKEATKRPTDGSSSGKSCKVPRSASTSTNTATSLNAAILPNSLVRGSIQSDPTASATYKSLFTTCDEAKRQTKPNWVTYNPLYFR